jgi:hypothetical protein
VDKPADRYEAELNEAADSDDSLISARAEADLALLNNDLLWHSSYYNLGAHLWLKSLNKRFDVDVFNDYVMKNAFY